jgi:hypothetical protein
MNTSRAASRRHFPASPFQAQPHQPLERYALQDRVTHDRYGLGRVVGVEEDAAVLVDFGGRQVRIPVPYAKLSKL